MKEYQLHGLRALAQSPKGTVPAFLQAPATQGAWRFHHALEDYGPTPLVRLNGLAEELGLGGVFVKDESHRFGLNAFKGLGGIYALSRAVARELGLDEFHAELLPGDKVDQVERLLAQKQPKENLVFVGDGINDAPVLSRADIGVAMGALGSDAAIEAADIVLMDDDLSKLAQAVRIARKTLSIVRQNIVFALAVKGLVLVLSALGYVGMWWAVFADVGVSVLAILNASRMLRAK